MNKATIIFIDVNNIYPDSMRLDTDEKDDDFMYSKLTLAEKVKFNRTHLPKPTPYLEVMQTTWYLYDKERGVI